jgi:tetratricopeptide (TPR) repeat protein
LLDQQRDFLVNLGNSYLQEKKYADSERIFATLQQRFPDSEWGAYGLGRVQQEQGKHQAALPLFEKAATLAPQPRARIHFRIALSQQALGEKAKAITSFEKALAAKPALNKKMKEDALDKLKSLKS